MVHSCSLYRKWSNKSNVFSQVVYMARNPKDVVLSFFHHCRIFKNHAFEGTFEQFVQYFLDDDCKI